MNTKLTTTAESMRIRKSAEDRADRFMMAVHTDEIKFRIESFGAIWTKEFLEYVFEQYKNLI